ncbi:TaqI-like C-terminal specificity domain-containing protein [Micromonospora narathiwatensis]|uniref:site-specific DNA-methyltransferase (adenine-specific) n=1 Tax=Micromonospora narathiwatensis TaxID=299146 RepID=A0A1A9A670_9ACTN|nr:TaqI-like C-terminal specificity domain-containing protein [Micromonospora narathiwatensis]
MPVPPAVEELVERFLGRRAEFESPSYLEARVRVDFLNPFFQALGWDVTNHQNVPECSREVITEARLRVGAQTKAPDYLFQAFGEPAFIVEAKKPSVRLRDDPAPALQLRRYGWNSGQIAVGLLTDFQELSIYDCRVPPAAGDRASVALLEYLTVEDYVKRWDYVEERFSRDAVAAGSIPAFFGRTSTARGWQRVDKAFLSELEEWRVLLAGELAALNPLSSEELNFAVQLTIDRLVFLRVCEDRGLEPYGQLLSDVNEENSYRQLLNRFRRADEKYNSGLFHLRKEHRQDTPDTLTPQLKIGSEILRRFVRRLYWPEGPYDFAVLPPDILGQVYEQFLGKVITLSGRAAVVEDKPEVRKAGGVFYTPTGVVRDIVSAAMKEPLTGASPEKLSKSGFYVCDPSCGSGSFLIEVYQYLLDWHLEYYVKSGPERYTRTRPARLEKTARGEWRLTSSERKRILLAHVYGVDIDPQAVEVTKLALLLKVLEGETERSVDSQLELFHERALPNLDDNIKCGNSLVGTSFHASQALIPSPEIERRINAFDWDLEFPAVANGRGFDVIVGNPPWLMAGYYVADTVPYLKDNFLSATGKFDLYYVFVEQALRLLAKNGRLGFIIPNKFFHTSAAKSLRELLTTSGLHTVKDFGLEKIFERATNYSCVIFVSKKEARSDVTYSRLTANLLETESFNVPRSDLGSRTWSFQDAQGKEVLQKLAIGGAPLEQITERFGAGVQTGSDKLLTFTPEQAAAEGIESELLTPLLRGRDVRGFQILPGAKLALFPYRNAGDEFELMSEEELRNFPNAWAYLSRHKAALGTRVWFNKSAAELSGKWYGLMYVERARFFQTSHLLTPCLSDVANFARGNGDLFATGTAGVAGVAPRPGTVDVRYLLALLNSKALSVFATENSPAFQGGYRKFSSPYLKALPVPLIEGKAARSVRDRMIEQGEEIELALSRMRKATTPHERTVLARKIAGARAAIDIAVFSLFGLNAADRRWVEKKYGAGLERV